jgi:hypothetical protein
MKTLEELVQEKGANTSVQTMDEWFVSIMHQEPGVWFQDMLNRMTIHTENGEFIFRIDGKRVMSQFDDGKRLHVNPNTVWSIFRRFFGLEEQEISQLIKQMTEKHFSITVGEPETLSGANWAYPIGTVVLMEGNK